MRDHLVRRVALVAVLALTLTACGSGTQPPSGAAPSTSPSPSVTPALDASFPVQDGRMLSIHCAGVPGAPTVVFEAGEGVPSSAMDGLATALAPDYLVCTYDRANMGASDPAPTPRSAADVIADLHNLLTAAKVPGPYLLVGHSAGGMFVQAYARQYPDEVAGVVAMNPVPPWGPWEQQALPLMTEPERADEAAYYDGSNGEDLDYRTSSAQLAGLPAPPAVPFVLLLSTIVQCDSPDDVCGRTYPAYEALMADAAAEWPDGAVRQVEAGHDLFADARDDVVAAVDEVAGRASGG